MTRTWWWPVDVGDKVMWSICTNSLRVKNRGSLNKIILKVLKEKKIDEIIISQDYKDNINKIFGFENLNGPMGDTCHHNCDVHMTKKLQ